MKQNRVKIVLIILIIVVIISVICYILLLSTNVIEQHSFYQYFGGKKVEYNGKLVITSKNDITELLFDDIKIQLDSTPIFYGDLEDKVLFPQSMAIVYPLKNGKMCKINAFSNIEKIQESVYVLSGKDKFLVDNSFLYDGNDMYFFLKDTKIIIGKNEISLPPLSYVIVTYNNSVEIYNKQLDKYTVTETNDKNILAITEDYSINLSVDTIKYDSKEQILLKKINALELIKE